MTFQELRAQVQRALTVPPPAPWMPATTQVLTSLAVRFPKFQRLFAVVELAVRTDTTLCVVFPLSAHHEAELLCAGRPQLYAGLLYDGADLDITVYCGPARLCGASPPPGALGAQEGDR